MRARLATREGDDFARLELAPARRRSQVRTSGEDDDHLLVCVLIVIGPGTGTGGKLIQACPYSLASRLPSDPRPLAPVVLHAAPFGLEYVRHRHLPLNCGF